MKLSSVVVPVPLVELAVELVADVLFVEEPAIIEEILLVAIFYPISGNQWQLSAIVPF